MGSAQTRQTGWPSGLPASERKDFQFFFVDLLNLAEYQSHQESR